jgi:hypothetical protein
VAADGRLHLRGAQVMAGYLNPEPGAAARAGRWLAADHATWAARRRRPGDHSRSCRRHADQSAVSTYTRSTIESCLAACPGCRRRRGDRGCPIRSGATCWSRWSSAGRTRRAARRGAEFTWWRPSGRGACCASRRCRAMRSASSTGEACGCAQAGAARRMCGNGMRDYMNLARAARWRRALALLRRRLRARLPGAAGERPAEHHARPRREATSLGWTSIWRARSVNWWARPRATGSDSTQCAGDDIASPSAAR